MAQLDICAPLLDEEKSQSVLCQFATINYIPAMIIVFSATKCIGVRHQYFEDFKSI